MPFFFYNRSSDGTIEEFYGEMPGGTTHTHVIPSCIIEQDKDKGKTSSLAAFRSNYEKLPHHLKSCLDYCYILCKKYAQDKGKIVRLLLAQGLIPEKPGKIIEDTAENIIKELIGLGMLEERYVFYSEVKVPKLYVKSCLVEVEEQDFISKVANSLTHAFIKNDGQELPPNFNRFQIQSLFASVDYCDGHIGPLSQVFWQTVCGLRFLLVLNLYAAVEYLPDEVGDLVHLKYLLLSNSKIKKLPLTIGNLQKLQTLEVHDCSKQFELPVEILNIKQLRHLLLCDTLRYEGGIRVPMGIGTLVNLQTFTGVYVGAGIASELSCLTQLRKLDVQDVSEDHVGELFASIIKLENLVSLSLNAEQAGKGTLLPELEPFSPPPHLQELVLRGGLVEMLNWLPSIENLTSLALCHSNILENPSSVLQFLPKLKHLRLWEAYKAKLIGKEFCESGGFPKLETLIIASGDLVEWIEIVNGAFPSLRNLQFWNCLNLRFLPKGLQNISTIQELFLTHLHGDLERRLSGEENYKIKHISKFYWDMPIS